MSGRHAEIRSEDAEFFVHDAGSRNGVALGVRGERPLKQGSASSSATRSSASRASSL